MSTVLKACAINPKSENLIPNPQTLNSQPLTLNPHGYRPVDVDGLEGLRDLAELPRHLAFKIRVEGLGFRVWDLGFRVEGSRCRVQGSECRVQGLGFRVQGAGCRVQGAGFRVQGAGCRPSRPRTWFAVYG